MRTCVSFLRSRHCCSCPLHRSQRLHSISESLEVMQIETNCNPLEVRSHVQNFCLRLLQSCTIPKKRNRTGIIPILIHKIDQKSSSTAHQFSVLPKIRTADLPSPPQVAPNWAPMHEAVLSTDAWWHRKSESASWDRTQSR